MPLFTWRQDARRRILVTAEGELSFAAVAMVIEGQLEDGAWSYGVLYDARLVTEVLPADDLGNWVEKLQTLVSEHGPRGPVAVVTTSPDLRAVIKNYSEQTPESLLQIQAFDQYEMAERWLDDETRVSPGAPPRG